MTFAKEKNINWSPDDYAEAAVLAREVGEEMLSRLDWMTLKPRVVLDAGCGTGELTKQLIERYQAAEIIALDHSPAMLEYAKKTLPAITFMSVDAATLPLPNQSVDLIFANLLLPWHENTETLLREWRRVLRPDGLLMFTAFGPDTLKTLNQSIVPAMIDMHDIGDIMLRMGFADPVLDVNHYTLAYNNHEQMIQELYATGMLQSQNNPLIDSSCEAVYEIVFAHAFLPAESDEISASEDGMVRVPLAHLRRRLRGSQI